jgi:hypothetical protein
MTSEKARYEADSSDDQFTSNIPAISNSIDIRFSLDGNEEKPSSRPAPRSWLKNSPPRARAPEPRAQTRLPKRAQPELHAAKPKRDQPEVVQPHDWPGKCHVPLMRTRPSRIVHLTQHGIINRSPNQELSDFYDNRPEVAKTCDRPPK